MSDVNIIESSDAEEEEIFTFEDIICIIHDNFETPHQECMSQKVFWNHLVQMIEEKEIMIPVEEELEKLKLSLKRMANFLALKVKPNCRTSFTDTMMLVKEAKGSYYKTSYSAELKRTLQSCLTSFLPNWIVSHETCCLSPATTPTSTSSTIVVTPEEVAGVIGEKKSTKRKTLNFEDDCNDSDEEELKNSHLPTGVTSSYISVRKEGDTKHRILTER